MITHLTSSQKINRYVYTAVPLEVNLSATAGFLSAQGQKTLNNFLI